MDVLLKKEFPKEYCVCGLLDLLEYNIIHRVNHLSLFIYLDCEFITYHIPCMVIGTRDPMAGKQI